MEDPYSNRKNKPYEEMAESCKDLAETAKELEWMVKFFLVAVSIIVGFVVYGKFFS